MEIKKSAEKSGTHRLLLDHNVFIVWQPEYNLGIPIIDEHHRGIVTTINTLHFGIQNSYAKDILRPVVDMMYDYTHIHFQIEETFLEEIDFPSVKRHHELHRDLTAKLASAGRHSLLDRDPYEFLEFLKDWWINHICREDLIFRDHLFASK